MKKAMVRCYSEQMRPKINYFLFIFIVGKDAAGIAMEAINFARDSKIDIVLVDTAGRMQDNEPLMRALAKVVFIFGCKTANYEMPTFYGPIKNDRL
jgi:signal recognition particle GTPase